MTAQTTTAPAAVSEARVNRFLAQVFLVMAVGLLVTALVAGQVRTNLNLLLRINANPSLSPR